MDKKEIEAYDRAIKKMKNIGIDACYQSQIIALLQLETELLQKRIEELQDQLRIARNSVPFAQLEAVTQESTLAEIIKATAESGYNISISLYKSEEENSND